MSSIRVNRRNHQSMSNCIQLSAFVYFATALLVYTTYIQFKTGMILNRTIRVDHCEQYRAPNADMSKIDELTAAVRVEGCAPAVRVEGCAPVTVEKEQIPIIKQEKDHKEKKRKHKEKKSKKKKKKKSKKSGSDSDSSE